MIILGIETSCDETAVCVVEATGELNTPAFSVKGNALYSQVALHAQFGGVFPTLAKREHGKNLTALLQQSIEQAYKDTKTTSPVLEPIEEKMWEEVREILSKEDNLYTLLRTYIQTVSKPDIDLIAVTSGPGLEPALWVGISFARALGLLWNIPVLPVNHMEGHILSVLVEGPEKNTPIIFPALALLISGGHTELVDIQSWGQYRVMGSTRDDAVGEAFDKVARMLHLPYPGGPEVSKKAAQARTQHLAEKVILPRPMIHSSDFDFSFSGLKTAVLYSLKEKPIQTEEDILDMCRAFEDAVVDVLISKTSRALEETGAQSLIIAGGVSANSRIREAFTSHVTLHTPHINLCIPDRNLSTDNAIMIACAGYIEYILHPEKAGSQHIRAEGNAQL